MKFSTVIVSALAGLVSAAPVEVQALTSAFIDASVKQINAGESSAETNAPPVAPPLAA